METKSNLLSYLKIILINTFIFLIGLFLIEIFFILYIKSHSLQQTIELPQFLRHYIKFNITDIIQNKEDCAKYDKELFYTLKPGNCVFILAAGAKGCNDFCFFIHNSPRVFRDKFTCVVEIFPRLI